MEQQKKIKGKESKKKVITKQKNKKPKKKKILKSEKKDEKKRGLKKIERCFLNDIVQDNLMMVFSFLDYGDLEVMRNVCQEIRNKSDTFPAIKAAVQSLIKEALTLLVQPYRQDRVQRGVNVVQCDKAIELLEKFVTNLTSSSYTTTTTTTTTAFSSSSSSVPSFSFSSSASPFSSFTSSSLPPTRASSCPWSLALADCSDRIMDSLCVQSRSVEIFELRRFLNRRTSFPTVNLLAFLLKMCSYEFEHLNFPRFQGIEKDQIPLVHVIIANGVLQGLSKQSGKIELSLQNTSFGKSGIRAWAKVLATDKVRSLDINRCGLTDEDISVLFPKADEKHTLILPSLEHLDLSSNKIGNEGAKIVSNTFIARKSYTNEKNPMTLHVDISSNPLGAEGELAILQLGHKLHCTVNLYPLLRTVVSGTGAEGDGYNEDEDDVEENDEDVSEEESDIYLSESETDGSGIDVRSFGGGNDDVGDDDEGNHSDNEVEEYD